MKERIIISDFDGTLTLRDTLFEIIAFNVGHVALLWCLLVLSPWLVLMKLGLYSNQRAKERLLYSVFRGMSHDSFAEMSVRFARSCRGRIMRHDLLSLLQSEAEGGAEVIVVTASPAVWVRPFVPGFTVIGTEMEFDDKGFTGHFSTPNCYGPEKVRRVLDYKPDILSRRANYHITAYGDSRGDREMLEYADEPHLVR
ncbi:MAG: HAD family hydrolase [Prevotella sp.]